MLLRGHVWAEPGWAHKWQAAMQLSQFAMQILTAACSVKLIGVQVIDQRRVLDFADVRAAWWGTAMQEVWLHQGPISMEPHKH